MEAWSKYLPCLLERVSKGCSIPGKGRVRQVLRKLFFSQSAGGTVSGRPHDPQLSRISGRDVLPICSSVWMSDPGFSSLTRMHKYVVLAVGICVARSQTNYLFQWGRIRDFSNKFDRVGIYLKICTQIDEHQRFRSKKSPIDAPMSRSM